MRTIEPLQNGLHVLEKDAGINQVTPYDLAEYQSRGVILQECRVFLPPTIRFPQNFVHLQQLGYYIPTS